MTREEAIEYGGCYCIGAINKIYDDFESQICENCEFYDDYNESSGLCNNRTVSTSGTDKDFGCKKFKGKQDEH